MNVAQLKQFCRSFPQAMETFCGEPYNFLVYSVGGRKFAYFKTSEPERWRFSMRVAPERFLEVTDVPGVKPARYRGRHGWITIVNVSTFPADYLRELVGWSFQRALASSSNASDAGLSPRNFTVNRKAGACLFARELQRRALATSNVGRRYRIRNDDKL